MKKNFPQGLKPEFFGRGYGTTQSRAPSNRNQQTAPAALAAKSKQRYLDSTEKRSGS
jgi:hypothetical protein